MAFNYIFVLTGPNGVMECISPALWAPLHSLLFTANWLNEQCEGCSFAIAPAQRLPSAGGVCLTQKFINVFAS